MANLIDISYFVQERNIPNSGNKDVMESINWFITKYEPELLSKLFGYSLWQLYLAEDPIVVDSRFDKLVNGVEYTTADDILLKWDGIRSMIVDYVYYYYMKDASSHTTGMNVIIPKSDAAFSFSPAIKMVSAWNSLSTRAAGFLSYMYNSNYILETALYPEFTTVNSCYVKEIFQPINDFDL